jgi:hypothetical protein
MHSIKHDLSQVFYDSDVTSKFYGSFLYGVTTRVYKVSSFLMRIVGAQL